MSEPRKTRGVDRLAQASPGPATSSGGGTKRRRAADIAERAHKSQEAIRKAVQRAVKKLRDIVMSDQELKQALLDRPTGEVRVSSAEEVCFEIIPGDPTSPCIVHVPHASRRIPADVRRQLLLDDEELAIELRHITDARTDEIALTAAERAPVRPWLFVNRLSRLVVDPERFPDDREEMVSVGMGAVYTQTSHRRALRDPDAGIEQDLLERYFHPYAEALAELVDDRLQQTGSAVLLDLHSYPARALPYELHQQARRPAVCLGVDEIHTPAGLLAHAEQALRDLGDAVVGEPFAGTYVPLRHYRCDPRVASLMVELRRDSYLDNRGELDPARAECAAAGLAAVAGWCRPSSDGPPPAS